jgi:hypothetical protein
MGKRVTFLMFKNQNHLMFDIQHLSAEEKRKEIMKYDPLHYIFGFTLVCKPWLTIEEMYEYSNKDS